MGFTFSTGPQNQRIWNTNWVMRAESGLSCNVSTVSIHERACGFASLKCLSLSITLSLEKWLISNEVKSGLVRMEHA